MSQNRRKFVTMALAVVASLFAVAAVQSKPAQASGGGNKQLRLEGRLTRAIGADRVAAIRLTNGQTFSIFIPTTAKVERNDVKVQLKAFKANDAVQARFAPDGTTVIKFEGVGP